MALIVCGHQRSGTTALQKLCDCHPDMAMTNEFGNFFDLGEPFSVYRNRVLRLWWRAQNRSFFLRQRRWSRSGYDEAEYDNKRPPLRTEILPRMLRLNMLQNLWFVVRYLFGVNRAQRGYVDIRSIEFALRGLFPTVHMGGDRHPDYIWVLDTLLAGVDGLFCVVIYRDARDVTASSLIAARTAGRRWFGEALGTAEKTATRWVRAIEIMERHSDKVHMIRYEDLVTDPLMVLTELGQWLGVDPYGFNTDMIQPHSVGRYRDYLSSEELADVIRIAGPTMRQLAYDF